MTGEAAPNEALTLSFDAVPEIVPKARLAVADYARACEADVHRVALAVSEAVTNVVLHAYRDREPGPLLVNAELVDSDLVVTVADEGLGMTPNPDSSGLRMGLAIIGALAADTQLRNGSEGLEVRMRFPCAGEDD